MPQGNARDYPPQQPPARAGAAVLTAPSGWELGSRNTENTEDTENGLRLLSVVSVCSVVHARAELHHRNVPGLNS